MFVRNAWYIGALAHELAPGSMLARTILGEPLLFVRDDTGRAAVLADRCPHRFAPLSAGALTPAGVRCGYHGMVFDLEGACVANPVCPGDPLPRARVRTIAAVERHGFIWVWPGDATPEPERIPDYAPYDDPAWTARTHHMRVEANYLLLVDNLLDLSHIAFVHADVLGNDDVVDQQHAETISDGDTVIERRLVPNGEPIPVWREVLGPSVSRVDLWMDIRWSNASNIMLDVGSTPSGQPRDSGAGILNLDCITPETATSSHYFYGHARQYRRDDPAVSDFWSEAMTYAFAQDKAIVEAVQSRMGATWDLFAMDPPPIINRTDRAAVLVRRRIAQSLKTEAAHAGA